MRGGFYCALIPMWEGFDEYAHFARLTQGPLPNRTEGVSKEVEATFHLAPLPDQLAWMGPWTKTHRQWWAQSETDRAARLDALARLPPAWARLPSDVFYDAYESQQAPLYYWLLMGPARLISGWNIQDRVLAMRLLSLLLASFAIPLTYLAGRNLLGREAGIGAALLLAVSPMLSIDVARVANDCLALSLLALLLYFLTQAPSKWWKVGLVLGFALLTKAYVLTVIPALILVWRKRPFDAAKALATSLAIAGWWYGRNLLLTGSLTGWFDDAPLSAILANLFRVDWPHAAGAVFKTAIWFGGWSFLTVKAWLYNVLLLILAAAALAALRKFRQIEIPASILGWFLAGVVYDVTAEFVTQRTSSAPGWYLWAVCSAVAVVLACGAGKWTAWLALAIAAFDVYTSNFVLLPYYSGMAGHGRTFARVDQVVVAMRRMNVPVQMWVLSSGICLILPVVVLLYLNFNRSKRCNKRQTGLT